MARAPNRNNKAKVPLYRLKVDAAKQLLYDRLQKRITPGPGCIHFPEAFGKSYFDQLTAEKCVLAKDGKGFTVRVWKLKSDGRRNEALDTAVYSCAALQGLKVMGLDLEREAKRYAAAAPPDDVPAVSGEPRSEPKQPARRRRRKWKPAQL